MKFMNSSETIKLDVEQVLRTRAPRFARFIPQAVTRWLKRLIRQDEMNALLEANAGRRGADFCRGVLRSLDVKVETRFADRLPPKEHRRVVFVSNHPLGGLDGMALIEMVQRHYGGSVRFVVNDILMAIKPLEDVFLPINKFGSQSRRSLLNIEKAFAGNDPIIIFPAGLVSRYRKTDVDGVTQWMVRDLPWQKMFVTRCVHHKRDVVPLLFGGQNSQDFYKKANLRKRLGLKFNIEQLLLPREVFLSRGKTFTISVGALKPWGVLAKNGNPGECAHELEREVYSIGTDSDCRHREH